jgi:hypothetical protein
MLKEGYKKTELGWRKSNIIDGIAFLNRRIQGKELQSALDGENAMFLDTKIGAIRGGSEWIAMKPFIQVIK